MNVRGQDKASGYRTKCGEKCAKSARKRRGTAFAHINSVMENMLDITGTEGSMMAEYVIAVTAIGAVLAIFMNRMFFDFGDGFGPLGQQFVAFYQKILGGLSLPVP